MRGFSTSPFNSTSGDDILWATHGTNAVAQPWMHSFGQCEDCGSVELLSWCLLCRSCHERGR